MFEGLKNRWNRFRFLLNYRYFLWFYYGERLGDYPLSSAVKMLLSRFIFLTQLPLLLPDRHFLVNYYGTKMYVGLCSAPPTLDIALGVYEYWKIKLLFQLVKEDMTILDIGSCQGNYSILCAKLMRDKGRVIAFEPDPDNCNWIMKNIRINNFRCIELHRYALSDREGETTFYPGGGMGSLVSRPSWNLGPYKGTLTVKTRMLDNVLNEVNISQVDLIKIDVEGSDLLVLRGAERTLKNSKMSLLMDVDIFANSERKELFELLTSCGFELYRIGKELKPIKSANELFLHDDRMRPKRIGTDQMIREIYACKSK